MIMMSFRLFCVIAGVLLLSCSFSLVLGGVHVPDWAQPTPTKSHEDRGIHTLSNQRHSYRGVSSSSQPHWSSLRTAREFVRLPIERRSFTTEANINRDTVNRNQTRRHGEEVGPMIASILPPRKSHGLALRQRRELNHTVTQTSTLFHHRSRATSTTNGALMVGCAALDFTIPCTFGSSTTSFDLLFDTGSSTLAIAGSSCSSCTSAGVARLYGNTGVSTGKTASGSYGDGSGWSGNIYTDSVSIKGSSGTNLGSVSMSFASMTQQTNNFFSPSACFVETASASLSQGIIGFGYQSLALANTDSFPMKLFNSNPSMTKSFYVEMCLYDGALWFSGMALSNYGGQFYYVPITVQEYYRIDVTSITVNGNAVGSQFSSSVESIVDSGTTMWSIPTAQFNAVTAAINANAKFKLWFGTSFWTDGNCYNIPNGVTIAQLAAELPTIGVNLNGVQIQMKSVGSYLLPCDRAMTTFTAGIDASSDGQIMGWAFMNALVVHHDIANARIGFAVQYGCEPKWFAGSAGSGATITGTSASGPTGTAGASMNSFTITRPSTTMNTNSKVTLTVTPSAAPAASVTLSMTCADSVTTQASQSITFTSSSSLTIDATSLTTPASLTCSFTVTGTNSASFTTPASITFQVTPKTFTVTPSSSSFYIGGKSSILIAPSVAPATSFSLQLKCVDSSSQQTVAQSVTFTSTSFSLITVDVTAGTVAGALTCSFTVPTGEFTKPANIPFTVLALKQFVLTSPSTTTMYTNSNLNVPVSLSSSPATSVSLAMTCSDGVTVQAAQTLTFTSTSGTGQQVMQVNSLSRPGTLACTFTVGGADAAIYANPSTLNFQVQSKSLTVTSNESILNLNTKTSIVVTPNMAPSTSVSLQLLCTDAANFATTSATLTIQSSSSLTIDVMAGANAGQMTCAFTLSSTEFSTPSNLVFTVMSLKSLSVTQSISQVYTNSQARLTLTPSATPSSTLTTTIKCTDSAATQLFASTLTFTSSASQMVDINTLTNTGVLTCTFTLSGSSNEFIQPSNILFTVLAKSFNITQSATQLYPNTKGTLTIRPNVAPSSTISVQVRCTDSSATQLLLQSLTFTSTQFTSQTMDVTSSTNIGTMTCAFTSSTVEYAKPSNIQFQVLAFNVLSITILPTGGSSTPLTSACIGVPFTARVTTISLTGSLEVKLNRQFISSSSSSASAIEMNTTSTLVLTSSTPSASVIQSINTTGILKYTLQLGPSGGVDAARFNFAQSTLTIEAKDCSVSGSSSSSSSSSSTGPSPTAISSTGGSGIPSTGSGSSSGTLPSSSTGLSPNTSAVDDSYFIVLYFDPDVIGEVYRENNFTQAQFVMQLKSEVSTILSVSSTQIKLLRIYFDADNLPSSGSFYFTATATATTKSTTTTTTTILKHMIDYRRHVLPYAQPSNIALPQSHSSSRTGSSSTTNPSYGASRILEIQVGDANSPFRRMTIGRSVTSTKMVACVAGTTCEQADKEEQERNQESNSSSTKILGMTLWIMLVIFIGGGIFVVVLIGCLIRYCCARSSSSGSTGVGKNVAASKIAYQPQVTPIDTPYDESHKETTPSARSQAHEGESEEDHLAHHTDDGSLQTTPLRPAAVTPLSMVSEPLPPPSQPQPQPSTDTTAVSTIQPAPRTTTARPYSTHFTFQPYQSYTSITPISNSKRSHPLPAHPINEMVRLHNFHTSNPHPSTPSYQHLYQQQYSIPRRQPSVPMRGSSNGGITPIHPQAPQTIHATPVAQSNTPGVLHQPIGKYSYPVRALNHGSLVSPSSPTVLDETHSPSTIHLSLSPSSHTPLSSVPLSPPPPHAGDVELALYDVAHKGTVDITDGRFQLVFKSSNRGRRPVLPIENTQPTQLQSNI